MTTSFPFDLSQPERIDNPRWTCGWLDAKTNGFLSKKQLKNKKKQINVYADIPTSKYLNLSFSYCFKSYSIEYPATLKLKKIDNKLPTSHNTINYQDNDEIEVETLGIACIDLVPGGSF